MEHGRYLVDLVDENGLVVGSKPRREIDKKIDLYHVVYVILISPEGQLILARIPRRDDLPNLYSGRLGAAVATIRRSGESPMAAARRAVAREIYIDDAEVIPAGGGLFEADGKPTYVSVYYMIADVPETYSSTDIAELVKVTSREFRQYVEQRPDELAPNLVHLWHRYQSRLPL
jgi:hypothetical protein